MSMTSQKAQHHPSRRANTKKGICYILAILLTVSVFPFPVSAEHNTKLSTVSEVTETFSNGSYVVISVCEEPAQARSGIYKKDGSKVYTFFNASGAAQWKYTITGVFNVNTGISSVCTSSVHSFEIYNSNWSCSSANSYTSGNRAISNAEFIRKLLGITVERENFQIALTCDSNGNLS